MCSVPPSCPTLCNPMDCSTSHFPVLHYLPQFAEAHVHQVSNAIQPSHPLLHSLLLPSIFPSIRVILVIAGMHGKSLQLCPTLCDSVDHNPPGSSVQGILQARMLKWVAMPSSRGSSQSNRKWQPAPVMLPGKFHGHRRLAGYNPQGRKKSDMTEHIFEFTCMHFMAKYISCFLKHNLVFNVLKKMDIHSSSKKTQFLLAFCVFYTNGINAVLYVLHQELAPQTISQPWCAACAEHTPQNAY